MRERGGKRTVYNIDNKGRITWDIVLTPLNFRQDIPYNRCSAGADPQPPCLMVSGLWGLPCISTVKLQKKTKIGEKKNHHAS